jgi:hypothetical protein
LPSGVIGNTLQAGSPRIQPLAHAGFFQLRGDGQSIHCVTLLFSPDLIERDVSYQAERTNRQ